MRDDARPRRDRQALDERATVAVDGGLSDNLEPLYGVRFDALHAERAGGNEPCRLVGLHCEEGDTLADAVVLDDPRPGDLLAVPVTGAYTYSLANNYNGIPRAAVLLCEDGQARPAVRREDERRPARRGWHEHRARALPPAGRAPRRRGAARAFVTHAYRPHSHPTWTIATVERGAARVRRSTTRSSARRTASSSCSSRRRSHTGMAGRPEGWAYKVLYIDPR